MLPSADCAAKVLTAASEASALSRTSQSMLSSLGAVAQGRVTDSRVQLRACRWMPGQRLLDQSS